MCRYDWFRGEFSRTGDTKGRLMGIGSSYFGYQGVGNISIASGKNSRPTVVIISILLSRYDLSLFYRLIPKTIWSSGNFWSGIGC